MSKVNPADTIVLEEMTTDPIRFFNNLKKLAWIVVHNHYYFVHDRSLQEDMVSAAVIKAWELLRSGVFDASRSSVRNYCYSGMRNEMQNIFYKHCKSVYVEEVRVTEETAPIEGEGYYPIDDDLVYSICDKFCRLGDYHNLLIQKLKSIGLIGEDSDLEPPETIDESVLNACFIEYIWRSKYGEWREERIASRNTGNYGSFK